MKLIVDRIENGFAVCEKDDLSFINIPLSDLPEETKEGSVLVQNKSGQYILDADEEEKRRAKLLELQKKLFKK